MSEVCIAVYHLTTQTTYMSWPYTYIAGETSVTRTPLTPAPQLAVLFKDVSAFWRFGGFSIDTPHKMVRLERMSDYRGFTVCGRCYIAICD